MTHYTLNYHIYQFFPLFTCINIVGLEIQENIYLGYMLYIDIECN